LAYLAKGEEERALEKGIFKARQKADVALFFLFRWEARANIVRKEKKDDVFRWCKAIKRGREQRHHKQRRREGKRAGVRGIKRGKKKNNKSILLAYHPPIGNEALSQKKG